jgi:hypothetical protein
VAGRPEAGADAVGEVLAVGVGDGERHDAGRAVHGDVGIDGVGEGFAGGVGRSEVVLPAVVTAGPDGLGLMGITQTPDRGAGGGGDGGEDDLGVAGGDLGHLVEDPPPAGVGIEHEPSLP